MSIARRALERKQKKDSGETVVVGENYFADAAGRPMDYGEVFELGPGPPSRGSERAARRRCASSSDNARVASRARRA